MDTLTVAPLRNLDDFILGSSRFQVRIFKSIISTFFCTQRLRLIVIKITIVLVFKVPDVSNPEKWANRVVSNLLYYQTNYLLSAAIIFALVSYLHPQEMAVLLSVLENTNG